MNQRIKKVWTSALRSGDYEQGMEYMNNDGKFCCLGVLCDLYRKEGLGNWKVGHGDKEDKTMSFDGCHSLIPLSVQSWAEVTEDPKVKGVFLSHHNDGVEGRPRNFEEIADMIDKEL